MKSTILLFAFMSFYQLSSGQIRPIITTASRPDEHTSLQLANYSSVPARELNTFRNFKESFDGDSKINAYLMAYVSCFVYPGNINRLLTGTIWGDENPGNTNDALFESNFKKKFEPFFWQGTSGESRPVIKFKRLPSNSPARSIGLDPEAVIISTPKMIIVAFRGTDRVLSQNELVKQWGEWVGTDFRAPMVTPGPGLLAGKVHSGFWKSVDLLRSQLDGEIRELDKEGTKQVWITGHSLGAAQAQVYAQYLIHSNTVPSSRIHCYMFDGPSFVGDQTFANSVNALGHKFQRFEYQMDMVTVVAPGFASAVSPKAALILGEGCVLNCKYVKSGKRNWFESPNTYRFAFRERDFLLGDMFTLNSACEHNPQWLVRSIYNHLSSEEKATVPAQPPCDNMGACNQDCSPVTASSVGTAIAQVAWQNVNTALSNLSTNILGGGDGTYRIACYKFKNWPKKYLHWDGTLGSQLSVSDKGTVFTLTHKLTGGYQLSRNNATVAADVEYMLGVPTGKEKSSRIITKQKDLLIGDEETWFLLKVPNTSNTYVLYNWNTKKVLSAADECIAGGNCNVSEKNAKGGEANQVWIFEKVN